MQLGNAGQPGPALPPAFSDFLRRMQQDNALPVYFHPTLTVVVDDSQSFVESWRRCDNLPNNSAAGKPISA